jgi:class 3 adenylate cyclase/HAMP domain-containing protein
MSIRLKIVLIVVPLVVATLALTGVSSYFSASHGITRVAKDFLGFKAQELQTQAESQWRLLVDNNLTGKPEMVAATQAAVEGYARSIVRSATELILAVGADGAVAMSTGDVSFQGGEQAAMASLAMGKSTDLLSVSVGGVARVGKGFWFDPFGWYVVVSEERAAFYDQVNQIAVRTGIILAGSILAGIVLVLIFARYLTRPLTRVVDTMKDIISTNDLSERVVVEYHDEIGQLAQTFNIMVNGLEEAYRQIKAYALKAAVSRMRERKIKEEFQKYVPMEVIEAVLKNESKVNGDERIMSVMFSHITNYADITAGLRPDELVQSLEPYFKAMVDTIFERGGIPDKYITDAVMAFFGAPAEIRDDAQRSVQAGLDMTEALADFNARRQRSGKKPFHVSVGINRGNVTVGTIGTEQKMDYTVIGDPVNLASRLSGLTRVYRQELLFSESVHRSVKDEVSCRLLDSVAVKGKKDGVKIYTARRNLSAREKEAWGLHNLGMAEYYDRSFTRAVSYFRGVLRILPTDVSATMLMVRSQRYQREAPPDSWDGVEVMTHK